MVTTAPTPPTSRTRARIAVLTAVATALLTVLASAAPASATAYRYWSYWQGQTGQWVMAQTGAADHTVVDEDVQGWRFAISTEQVSRTPDNAPEFAALCPDLAAGSAPSGQLRVAVVIDSGFVADAPEGQTPPADTVSCVTVADGSTGAQALAAAGTVTEANGLVCAINGYPADECSAEVSDEVASAAASAAATESPNPAVASATATDADGATAESSGSSTTALLAGAVLLVALIGAAFAIPALRRRRADGAAGADVTD